MHLRKWKMVLWTTTTFIGLRCTTKISSIKVRARNKSFVYFLWQTVTIDARSRNQPPQTRFTFEFWPSTELMIYVCMRYPRKKSRIKDIYRGQVLSRSCRIIFRLTTTAIKYDKRSITGRYRYRMWREGGGRERKRKDESWLLIFIAKKRISSTFIGEY